MSGLPDSLPRGTSGLEKSSQNFKKNLFMVYFYDFFKVEDNCFTTLCWFLPYNNMNQPRVYLPLLSPPPSSHPTL